MSRISRVTRLIACARTRGAAFFVLDCVRNVTPPSFSILPLFNLFLFLLSLPPEPLFGSFCVFSWSLSILVYRQAVLSHAKFGMHFVCVNDLCAFRFV